MVQMPKTSWHLPRHVTVVNVQRRQMQLTAQGHIHPRRRKLGSTTTPAPTLCYGPTLRRNGVAAHVMDYSFAPAWKRAKRQTHAQRLHQSSAACFTLLHSRPTYFQRLTGSSIAKLWLHSFTTTSRPSRRIRQATTFPWGTLPVQLHVWNGDRRPGHELRLSVREQPARVRPNSPRCDQH